jgi:hypothetical protein
MSTAESAHNVHPLFDPTSLYRQAMEESTFRIDNGEQSIRNFFGDRRRRELHRQWGLGEIDEGEPQDWSFGPAGNRMVHDHLLASSVGEPVAVPSPIGGPPRERTPALLVYRFDLGPASQDPAPLRTSSEESQPFTGCGREDGGGRSIIEFRVNINRDNVPGLPDGHIAMLMLITPAAANMLRLRVMDLRGFSRRGDLPRISEAEAITWITRALDREMLTARRPPLRALRVSNQLALCPALQGIIRDGTFKSKIDLGGEGPPLEEWTFAVLCVGQKVERLPEEEVAQP